MKNILLYIICFISFVGCFEHKNLYFTKKHEYVERDSLILTFSSVSIKKTDWIVRYQLKNLSNSPILFNGASRFNLKFFTIQVFNQKWEEIDGNFAVPNLGRGFFYAFPKYYKIIGKGKTLKGKYKMGDSDRHDALPFILKNGEYFIVLSYDTSDSASIEYFQSNYPKYACMWKGSLKDTLKLKVN